MAANTSTAIRYVVMAVVSYGVASYGSYKYGLITKAQSDLRDITDKRKFLLDTHEKFAEKYDTSYENRDFSNKIGRYRKTLLSYAEGDCIEFGCGTGANFAHYGQTVKKLVAVDWSSNMLMKAMNKEQELRDKS